MPLALYPDLLLLLWIFVVLFMDLFLPDDKRFGVIFTSSSLFLLGLSVLSIYSGSAALGNYTVRESMVPFRFLFSLCGFFSLLLARPAFQHGSGRRRLEEPGVFVILLLTAILGMHILTASSELITFFLGLEMATLPLYALCTWHRDKLAMEAGIKYLLIGALSTVMLLFGMSFIFGGTGSLHFMHIAEFLQRAHSDQLGLPTLGVLFILVALGFKLSAAPFHMWAPDVYAGAPTAVTAFIASASKVAGVAALVLLFSGPLAVFERSDHIDQALLLLAVASMLIGNLGALKQDWFNRFMAYSSIAQVGFILMALSGVFGELALQTVVFYLLVYVVSNYTAFFVMHTLAEHREERIASLRGLSQQSPTLALCMMIAMFSLAGIPPLAGFIGKIPLFFAAAQEGYYLMVFIAAINAVVALYYYMLVVKAAYITPAEGEQSAIGITAAQRWALLLLVAAVIVLGVWSGPQDWVFSFYGE